MTAPGRESPGRGIVARVGARPRSRDGDSEATDTLRLGTWRHDASLGTSSRADGVGRVPAERSSVPGVDLELEPPQPDEIVAAVAELLADEHRTSDPWWRAGLEETLEAFES